MSNFYVMAKRSGEEYFQYVSYEPEKGNIGVLDIGIGLHGSDDFALSERDARTAKSMLETRGYDVCLLRHFPGKDGIDLDQMVLEDETQPNLLRLMEEPGQVK